MMAGYWYDLNANWAVLSIPLFREVINRLGGDNIACIRMHPLQYQAYEEQGFAKQVIKLSSPPDLSGAGEPPTICGRPIEETLSQSLNAIDFVGLNGRTIGRIFNLEFLGINGWDCSRETLVAMARRGSINYRTFEHMLAKLEQGAA